MTDKHAADMAREALDRADAAAFTAAGFEVIGTGGGCTAWARQRADGAHILITDIGGTDHRRGADGFLVGLHDADGVETECSAAADLGEALERARALLGG